MLFTDGVLQLHDSVGRASRDHNKTTRVMQSGRRFVRRGSIKLTPSGENEEKTLQRPNVVTHLGVT